MTELTNTIPTPRKRAPKIVLGTAALVVAGGAAFAYWTAGGTGTGSAGTNGETVALTVVQTSTVANLRPGSTAQTLSGNFNNTNDEPIYVGTVTASISSVTKAEGAPAGTCAASDYTLSDAAMTVGEQVPVGNAQGAWTGATIAFNNKSGVNQDACKGATVNLAYTIS